MSVNVSVAFVPDAPTMSAAAPVAVYEIVLHDNVTVVVAVVTVLVVQVGVCAWPVILPDVPKLHPDSWIVAPPADPPNDQLLALTGVDDDSVAVHIGRFCMVVDVPEHPALLVHVVRESVENVPELSPSLSVAVPVPVHDIIAPDTEIVPLPVPAILHVVPVTHVTEAAATPVVIKLPMVTAATTTITRITTFISRLSSLADRALR